MGVSHVNKPHSLPIDINANHILPKVRESGTFDWHWGCEGPSIF